MKHCIRQDYKIVLSALLCTIIQKNLNTWDNYLPHVEFATLFPIPNEPWIDISMEDCIDINMVGALFS